MLIILLRRRKPEVVDLARGARELVAHGFDGAQCGHPRETRLVAYPFVHRLRVLAVKIIVPGLLACVTGGLRAFLRTKRAFTNAHQRAMARQRDRANQPTIDPAPIKVVLRYNDG